MTQDAFTTLPESASRPSRIDAYFNRPAPRFLLISVVLFLISFIAYQPSLNGKFIWDDDDYVVNNGALRSLDGLHDIWFTLETTAQYYPMTFTSFWLEWHLWGADVPRGYKTTNLLLHVLSASMVWVILSRLNVPGALAAAFLFAVHPVQVESVAWITERKNVLSGVFLFASLMVYLRYCGLTPITPGVKRSWYSLTLNRHGLYAIALLLFVLALLSKTVTAVMPAVVLLLIYWKNGRIRVWDVVPLVPLFVLGFAMGSVTRYVEINYVGAQGPEFQLAATPVGEAVVRTLIAGRAVWFYAGKLIYPNPLIFSYNPRWVISVLDVAQYAYPLGVGAVVVMLWRLRHRIGRGPVVGVMCFIVGLVPAMGFVNIYPMRYAFVADHFQYHACVALIAVLCAYVATLMQKWRSILANNMTQLIAAGVIAGCVALTYRQGAIYKNPRTLWDSILRESNMQSWIALNNQGVAYMERGKVGEAEDYFYRVLKLKPDHAESRHNLGVIAEYREDYPKALALYDEAIQLRTNHVHTMTRRAKLLATLGRNDEAISAYQSIAAMPLAKRWDSQRPYLVEAAIGEGQLRFMRGEFVGAVENYSRALKLDPKSTAALKNRAETLLAMGRTGEAIDSLTQATAIEPWNSEYTERIKAIRSGKAGRPTTGPTTKPDKPPEIGPAGEGGEAP